MFFLTFCGGSQVRPRESDNIVITMWGGTEILLPTLAEKMARIRKSKKEFGELNDSMIRRTNVITLMGGTEFKTPSIAREIEEMRKLKESGMIPEQEMLELYREALERDDMDVFETLTIMGGASEERPSIKDEIRDLKLISARGLISADEFSALEEMLKGKPAAKEIQERLRSLLSPSKPVSELPTTTYLLSQRELE